MELVTDSFPLTDDDRHQLLDLLVHRRGVVAIEDAITVSSSAHQVSLAPVVAVVAELPPSSEEEGVALAGRSCGSAAHAGSRQVWSLTQFFSPYWSPKIIQFFLGSNSKGS